MRKLCGQSINQLSIINSFIDKNESLLTNIISNKIEWSFDNLLLDGSDEWAELSLIAALESTDYVGNNNDDLEMMFLSRMSSYYLQKFSKYKSLNRRSYYKKQINNIFEDIDEIEHLKRDLEELLVVVDKNSSAESTEFLINEKIKEVLIEICLNNDPTTPNALMSVNTKSPIIMTPQIRTKISSVNDKFYLDDALYFCLRMVGGKDILNTMIKNNLFNISSIDLETKINEYGLNNLRAKSLCSYEIFINFLRKSLKGGVISISGSINPYDILHVNSNKSVTFKGGSLTLIDDDLNKVEDSIKIPNFENINFYDYEYNIVGKETHAFSVLSKIDMSLIRNVFNKEEIRDEYIYF